MEYILSYGMLLAETFSLCLLGDALLSKRQGPQFVHDAALWGIPALNMFLLMVLFPGITVIPKTCICLTLLFAALCIRYHIFLKEFILLIVVFYAVFYVADDGIMLSSMALFQYSYPEYVSDRAAYVCGAFSAKLMELTVCFLLGRVLKNRKKGSRLTPASWLHLLLIPALSLVIDISVIVHAVQTNDVDVWAVLITVGLLLCNIAVVSLWNQLEQERQTILENELLRQSAENNKEKVARLSEAYRQQRRQTHDFQSHMQAIDALLSAGEVSRALAYVRGWTDGPKPLSNMIVHTNNPLIDMLLEQKYQTARECGVSVSLLTDDLEKLPIKDADFVALLSNLVENAIEAAAQCEREKAVHIKLQQNPNGAFILSVRNTSNPVVIKNQMIRTTKPDTMAHGFGLANAKQIVAQNGGECYLLQRDGWVQFTASLPQNMHFTAQNTHFTSNNL